MSNEPDTNNEVPPPESSMFGDVRNVLDWELFREALFGCAASEKREKYLCAVQELTDALKDESGYTTEEEFAAIPLGAPLGPESEKRFAAVKSIIAEEKKRRLGGMSK